MRGPTRNVGDVVALFARVEALDQLRSGGKADLAEAQTSTLSEAPRIQQALGRQHKGERASTLDFVHGGERIFKLHQMKTHWDKFEFFLLSCAL